LRRRIADSTFFDADLPYFAMKFLQLAASAAIGARTGFRVVERASARDGS
jgi:hypothetical protein